MLLLEKWADVFNFDEEEVKELLLDKDWMRFSFDVQVEKGSWNAICFWHLDQGRRKVAVLEKENSGFAT